MIFFKIAILAAGIFFLLKGLRIASFSLIKDNRTRDVFIRVLPVIEIILWLSLFFWALHELFGETRIYPFLSAIIVIVLVSVTGWYLVRDLIAGVILKAGNAFQAGQDIITSSGSGKISSMGWRSIVIITGEGDKVYLPYSKLINEKITATSGFSGSSGYILSLKIPARTSAESIREILQKRLLEIPWIVPAENTRIRLSREDEYFIAEIQYQTLGPEMAIKTEEIIIDYAKKSFG